MKNMIKELVFFENYLTFSDMGHVSTYSFFSNETRMTVNIMLSLFILTLSDT